ncbi:unnamed protein product [Urochloa humidicola]
MELRLLAELESAWVCIAAAGGVRPLMRLLSRADPASSSTAQPRPPSPLLILHGSGMVAWKVHTLGDGVPAGCRQGGECKSGRFAA